MQEETLKGYRLSPQQRRLWGLLRQGRNEPYQTKCAVAIKGHLESGRLRAAAQNLIVRHEILRTTFQCSPETTIPMQVIEETGGLSWWEDDLSGLDEQEPLIEAVFYSPSHPVDFERGPFLDLHLIKKAEEDYVLIISLPAIYADSRSLRNLVGELSGSYAAAVSGEELNDGVSQYADLAEWQNDLIESEETRAGREYWRSRILLRPPTSQLGVEGFPASEAAFELRLEELVIAPLLSAQIESFARSEGRSLEQILLACWGILLWRHAGQSEIEIGTAFDGRDAAEIEDALGLFAKYLPITCRLESGLRFGELLDQIGQSFQAVRDWQEYFSWEQFVEPAEVALSVPFFSFCFQPETAPGAFLAGDVTFAIFKQQSCIDLFKIKLSYARRPCGLVMEFHYNAELFRAADIRCLMGHFHTLLESAITNPAVKIDALEMITEAERRRLLVEYNSTKTDWPGDNFVQYLFLEQARRTPDAVAAIYEDEWLTYHELNERADRIAGYLRGLGVGPEVVVGLSMERSLDLVAVLLGVLKAGGAYLPLDPSYPQERLSLMIEDAAAKVLLTHTHLLSRLPWIAQAQVVCVDVLWESIAEAPRQNSETAVSPDNLAYVIYTSGSTGRPKGVMLRHRSLSNYLLWAISHYPLERGCGAPVHSSLSFDLTITALFTPLLAGGHVHLLSAENGTEALGEALKERRGYSLVKLTPAHLQLLAEQLNETELDNLTRSFVIGGENLPEQAVRWWRERAGEIRLFNEYGPTESVVGCSIYEVGTDAEVEAGRASVPIGRPIANAELYILDERQRPVPHGVIGELCIGGEGLARGYLNHPDLTAERFAPHPCPQETGARLYRTGDLARYLSGGQIECLGRMDEQVKIRGYRIELQEIEAMLREASEVREAVVVAVESEDGQRHLIGYVAGGEGRKPNVAQLRQYLRERLPEYMIPGALIAVDTLPLTPNGKIDRKKLQSAKDRRGLLEQDYTGERTPVEEIVVGIFREVLKQNRVGRHDNFFEIGGHSLLATQVVSRVRNTFGVEIRVRNIFEKPTAEYLARRIEEAMRAGERQEAPPLARISREGRRGERLPLSFAQQRLWFLDQLVPNNPFYNIPCALRLDGRVNLKALERAINEIVRRHEVLRTRIEVEEGEPAQVIDRWESRSLEVKDLSSSAAEEREAEVRRIASEEAGTGFDLSRGPLLRVKVLKLGEEEHVVFFTMHHIVSDGWSTGILIREMGELYRAYGAGEESPLEELPIQYADFAVWQRNWLQGEALEAELEYWRRQLDGMEALELPADHPRPAERSYRGANWNLVVERELTERLREMSRREGATLFMTLLGGFDVLMSRYSGQKEVALGTDIANRNHAEIEGLIGFFVNQLVLRVEVRGEENFGELLKRVREVCLGAYAHQDVPFEKLVEELQPERDLSRSPLFQAKLIWQNAPREELELGELRLSGLSGGEVQTTRSDLNVSMMDEEQDLVVAVNYSRELFEEETIERLMSHYTNVLRAIVEQSERPVRELSLLSDQEREQIVVEWNETWKPYPDDRCIHELFAEQAKRASEQIALVDEGQKVSYGELNRRANRLGNYLLALGVGPEVTVGLFLERSVEMVVALLGVLKAGGAYLPLDPESPLERLGYMLEDAAVGVVLTGKKLEESLPAYWGQTVLLDEEWERISGQSDSEPESGVEAWNLAYVIYTSGSTGRPKGVMVRHRSLVNYTHDICRKLGLEEAGTGQGLQFGTVSTITADLGNTCIYPSLVSGGSLHILSYEAATDGTRFEEYLKNNPIDVLKIVPSHLGALLGSQPNGGRMLPHRYLILGGEALSYDLMELIGGRGEGCQVINHYGPTETTIGSLTTKVSETEAECRRAQTVPIGRPVANTAIYVLDRELTPVPVGVKGELYIGGAGLARGYLGRPELTAERFIPHMLSRDSGERVYRTGDVVRYLPDGKVEFIGRADEQVKVRGYRIELGEIQAILNEHRSVKQSVVVAREDERGEKRLLGYVMGEDGVRGPLLKDYLRGRLPEYMIPEAVVVVEEMPLTANGKIDRKRLLEMKESAADQEWEDAGVQTPVEEIVVGIFKEVLKVGRVGKRDNFFEIGGHSLLATQVVSRVRNTFGVEMEVRSIFEDGTPEGLGRRVEELVRAGERRETPPLAPVSREGRRGERLPLSFAQQRLWFLDQLVPNNSFYNIPRALRLDGRVNLKALERAINEIVRRHEVLRTRIEVEEGEPAQVIDRWESRSLEVKDLSSSAAEEREAEVRRIASEEAGTGFDLSRGPLLRVKVLKLGEEEHVVFFTMHHIVSDGWSTGILIREVGELYRAYSLGSAGEESPLEELPIQYADFAVWQRNWLQGEALEAELEYWRRQLDGMEALELPADHPRPAERSYRGANWNLVVERELTERLREMSRREGATLFMTLLGGFDVLMSRYSGQKEVALGTDIANRNHAEIEGLIGFFVNQLVLRVEVRGEENFGELLKRVREVCLGAYAHQDVPFEKLVEELQPERDLSRSPLFQAKLIWQNAPREELELGELRLSSLSGGEVQTARFDLAMSIMDEEQDLVVAVNYSRELFEEETIERLMSHYTNVLRAIVEQSERPVRELSLLSDREREQIVVEWNETWKPYPDDRCIHELFAEQAKRIPERTALIGDGSQLSYGELGRRANRLGNYLLGLGVGPEVIVGICLERSIEMVVAVMGVLKAGGAYLPLDPEYPLERLSFMLEDAGVGVVLTGKKLEESLPAYWGQTVLLDEEWERISGQSDSEPESGVEAWNLAYVIYTSGSTGRPKGVMVQHRGLCNLAEVEKEEFGLGERSRVLQFASLSFDASVWEIFSTLVAGGSLQVEEQESLMPGEDLRRVLQEGQITVVTMPPSVLAVLGEEELSHLQTVIAAGEACSAEIVERWAGGRRFFDAYGPTESTVCASMWECEAGGGRRPAIGRPIANMQLYLLDGELEPVPVGVKGELYIGGAGLARGYLGRPELTAERFAANKFGGESGGRLYRTGDVGRYMSDGRIEFVGRADEQVKVRGYRIELREIEAVLDEHRSVKQSVVVVREDERGGKRLLGYVMGEDGVRGPLLKDYLRGRLPEYMIPEVVVVEEMPLTANGKIDRKRLLEMKESAADQEWEDAGVQTPVEEIVVGIFKEVLKVGRVGKRDNFFEIGGHSLLATQVVSRVRNTFGVEMEVRSIFEDGTPEGLGRRVEGLVRAGERREAPPLAPVSREGQRGERLPLSFAQQRLWFIEQLDPGNALYNIPGMARLEGRLDIGKLEFVINEIVRRHEVLRTRIEAEEGEPAQVIDRWESRSLEVKDLSGSAAEEREAEVRRIASEEAGTGFDLSRGPLLRVKVLKLGEEEHVVFFTMHHIVSDGWSMGILIREVGELYRAFSSGSAGEESPLEELPIQYADFAVWQRNWLQGEVLEAELEYWRRQLDGMEALELPTDHPRPAERSHRGANWNLVVERELTERLREMSRREGATLFMTLLGGFDVLMSRYSRQEDVALGTDIANRNRAEIEGLIGFFVNQLVLRVEVRGEESFGELLKRVREVCLGAYAHQDVPFEKLVEELQPERDLSRSPLFQAKLIWQNAPREELELGELRLSRNGETRQTTNQTRTAKFDLTVSVVDAGHELVVVVNYSRDLFEEETIERLMSHYTNVLRAIVGDSEKPVRELSLLSDREREQITVEWNETGEMCPDDRCIHELFEQQVEIRPETIALIYENQQLTYSELNARANQLAHHLRRLSVGPETLVGICVERSLEAVVGLLAILKSGGAYIPLDPAYPVEHLTYMLEDSAPAVILTHAPAQAQIRLALAGVSQTLPVIDLETDVGNWAIQPHSNPDRTKTGMAPEQMAYVIYTSGSTGRPKGVVVEHAELTRLFSTTADWFHFDQNDVWTLFHSLAFDFSVWETWGALIYGGRLVVVPRLTTRSPEEFHQLLCGEMVTILNQTPSAFRQLMAAQVASRQTHQLRRVIFGGEALEVATLKSWYQDRRNQRTRLINMYGITETTVHVTSRRLEPPDSERPGNSPIGRRIPDLKVYLLDNHGQPVPIGVSAEMYVGGAGVARGYLNRPELTAERFVADPLAGHPGARMYKTGDLARFLSNGEMEFLGRNDFQVKVRGFRIELGEIEARLLRYPAIREAVVVARESDQGDKRLVAYYTVAPAADIETTVSAEVLRAHLSAALPEHMVPSAYVMLESLPLTTNGKLDRRALPSPGGEAYATREYEAPVGEIETALARIWADLLQLERVGRHDHFFALGGHSLLAVRLIERMRQKGLHADVRTLFTTPTLVALAAAVNSRRSIVDVPPNLIPPTCEDITPDMLTLAQLSAADIERLVSDVPGGAANVQDIYPLAPLQEGILFHHLMATEGDPYLVRVLYGFDTRSRLDRFLRAMQAVIDRHDILRTAVQWEGLPEPVQVVWRQAPLIIEEISFDPAAPDVAEQLQDLFDPRRYQLDIRRPPLIRVYIAHDARNDRWVMLCLFHHLALDHTAEEIFLEEVQAHLMGQADQLPAPLPFRNFVVQARRGVSQEDHEAFFRAMLNDVDEPTAPFGLINIQGDGSGIREARRVVDAPLAASLRQISRALGVSAASLYHLAWAQVLARVSGRNDVVFGTVLFGRMQSGEGADRVLGMFINTLPLRIRIGQESVEESIRNIHTLLTHLLMHEHAPLALAQRCSGVAPPTPLFSALLNYRHSMAAETVAVAAEDSLPVWEGMKFLGGEERTNYPFSLNVNDWGDGFALNAQVQSPIDPDKVCACMYTALEQLAETLELAPATPVRSLDVLPASERYQLLVEWNATQAEYPTDRCIHDLFEAQASGTPETIAVVFGVEQVSYGELERRANQLANYLRARGVGIESRVGICIERSVEMVEAVLGALKAGAACVPLDPAYPIERLRYMVADGGVEWLVTAGDTAEQLLEGSGAQILRLDRDREGIEVEASTPPRVTVDPDNLLYVIYTSGSTGRPKGVALSHAAVVNLIYWDGTTLLPQSRMLQFSSLNFDASFHELFATWASGGTIVLITREQQRDPRLLSLEIREKCVERLNLPAAVIDSALEELAAIGCDSVRELISTAEQMQIARQWWEWLEQQQCLVWNHYGPSETHVITAWQAWSDALGGLDHPPIGKPIANCRAYILNRELQPLSAGVVGELYLGGVNVARGYLNRPEQTAEKFVPDPHSPDGGARVYRTGDLASYLDDGAIEYFGRIDDQVKIRGYRVELGEIEVALRQQPGIADAAVVMHQSPSGDKRLTAYVVASPGSQADLDALRSALRQRLPDYMIPAEWMELKRFPLTANGKLDRRALPVPDRRAQRTAVAPRTPIEEIIAGVWSEVLSLEKVGVEENFFELGGHSLLATQVVSRLRNAFGVEVGVRSIFEDLTIERLASRIEEAIRADEKFDAPPLGAGAVLEKRLAYWENLFGGKPPVLDLPADHPRPPISSHDSGTRSFSLPVELSQSLKALSRREGATLFMTLLAAFKTLLYKYTAQEEIIVGAAVANGDRTEITPLIGFFMNMLPMKTDLSGNPRFRELLRRVREVALSGFIHQDLAFEKLIEEIRPESLTGKMPLFNVAFGMQKAQEQDAKLNGLEIKPTVAEPERAGLDLMLWVKERIEKIEIRWTYSRDLFEEKTIMRMHSHFEALLFDIVDRPDARLTTLKVMLRTETQPAPEEQDEWNKSEIEGLMSNKRKGINLSIEPA